MRRGILFASIAVLVLITLSLLQGKRRADQSASTATIPNPRTDLLQPSRQDSSPIGPSRVSPSADREATSPQKDVAPLTSPPASQPSGPSVANADNGLAVLPTSQESAERTAGLPPLAVRPARVESTKAKQPAKPKAPKNKHAPGGDLPGVEPLVPVEEARYALIFVGADQAAEAVWAEAINDLALPADARKDLIEDLNEEGFADPKHPTEDDLPLILSRIELIEMYAPEAIDDVNADAMEEAYKDLVNMANRLMAR